jgi:hypothetical protein
MVLFSFMAPSQARNAAGVRAALLGAYGGMVK